MTAGTKDGSLPTPQSLKRALVEAGFEVFRTRGDEITLADRVRENLIMDSGVRLKVSRPFEVRVFVRAQRSDYPDAEEAALFHKIRELAAPALEAGFREVETAVSPVKDPADATRVLDTFYEVLFTREAADLDAAFEGLRFALRLEKACGHRRGED